MSRIQRFSSPLVGLLGTLFRGLGTVLRSVWSVLVELARIGREMLSIPLELLLAVAEVLGALVLAVWRLVYPVGLLVWHVARDAVWWGRIHVRPAHGVLVVAAAAAVALGVSQFLDYRGVNVGGAGYAGAEGVAPPPEVDRASAGSAHAWAMIPIAALALLAVAAAALGRWRAARLLLPLGLAAIAISLLIDVPKGLDEGSAAVAYGSADAELLAGFWTQLAAGVVLALSGPLLSAYLVRGEGAARRGARGARRSGKRRSFGSSRVRETPIEGTR